MRANGSHSSDSCCVSRASAFGRPAQVNLEVHEAVILFDGQDFRHVEMSSIQKFELASQVEIRSPCTVLCGATTLACTTASSRVFSTSAQCLSCPTFGAPVGKGNFFRAFVGSLAPGFMITSAASSGESGSSA